MEQGLLTEFEIADKRIWDHDLSLTCLTEIPMFVW